MIASNRLVVSKKQKKQKAGVSTAWWRAVKPPGDVDHSPSHFRSRQWRHARGRPPAARASSCHTHFESSRDFFGRRQSHFFLGYLNILWFLAVGNFKKIAEPFFYVYVQAKILGFMVIKKFKLLYLNDKKYQRKLKPETVVQCSWMNVLMQIFDFYSLKNLLLQLASTRIQYKIH